jgi:carbon storage regulator CsrA
MLVLSRKEADKVVFPTLGITVEVLRVQGNTTRLGVVAPPEVPIYRHELADLKSIAFSTDDDAASRLRTLMHSIRQHLNSASSALNGLHQHMEDAGDTAAQQMVLEVYQELRRLDQAASEAVSGEEQRPVRALLVEGNENERELLAGSLRMYGFETTTATDGLDAWDFLSLHSPPDVVLLDMQMPRADGACLVNKIRSKAELKRLKLFALSPAGADTCAAPADQQGIDRWFSKPIDVENLITTIADELSGRTAA